MRDLFSILVVGLAFLSGCAPVAREAISLSTAVPSSTDPPSAAAAPRPSLTPSPLPQSPVPAPSSPPAPTATPTTQYHVYVFPVQPPEVCDYAEGVKAHGYPAIDIFAPKGADFVAVTTGIVDFVSTEDVWDPVVDDPATRGGLAVAIIGDDGVRYYSSHLSEVEPGIVVGRRVEAGELLGKVGDTGDARGKDTHLHFGISHPTYPGDWHTRRGELDPFSYLEAWSIDVSITPKLP